MKAINNQSILDCTELETEVHAAEMEQLSLAVFTMPDYLCDFKVDFLDDYHKRMNVPLVYESYLHRVFDFLESQDIKNGIDAFLNDENQLTFILYGQGYSIKGKQGILTTQVTVSAFDEQMKPVDFSNSLGHLVQAELIVQGEQMEV